MQMTPWWLACCLSFAVMPALAQPVTGAPPDSEPRRITFEKVTFDSLATRGVFRKEPVAVHGYLLVATAASAAASAPAAVLNPACEGLLAPGGAQVRGKYQRMARFLNDRGFTVLLVDGFVPRGFEENCSRMQVDPMDRLADAFGGLRYLRTRTDVDPSKVITVTWGNTWGLQGMNREAPALAPLGTGFAAAVMYYPECGKFNGRFAPYAPIQMFVGEQDRWNPAAPCRELAARQAPDSAPFHVKVYPDTYHSFDQPVGMPRINPYHPQLGMVGRNAVATADSFEVVDRFLAGLFPVRGAPAGSPSKD